jgi:hypothetical protein
MTYFKRLKNINDWIYEFKNLKFKLNSKESHSLFNQPDNLMVS